MVHPEVRVERSEFEIVHRATTLPRLRLTSDVVREIVNGFKALVDRVVSASAIGTRTGRCHLHVVSDLSEHSIHAVFNSDPVPFHNVAEFGVIAFPLVVSENGPAVGLSPSDKLREKLV